MKHFKAAYTQLLTRCQIREGSIGNCVPLENITVLNVSFKNVRTIDEIHSTATQIVMLDHSYGKSEQDIINEHLFLRDKNQRNLLQINALSEFSKNIIKYIAGYVVFKLVKEIKCQECLSAIQDEEDKHSLIFYKSKGFLKYPSEDVYVKFQNK